MQNLYRKILNEAKCSKQLIFIVFLFFDYFWVTSLTGTDAYYSVYVICAMISAIGAYDCIRYNTKLSREAFWMIIISSILFSSAVTMANYRLFTPLRSHVPGTLSSWLAGVWISYYILRFILKHVEKKPQKKAEIRTLKGKRKAFWIPFSLAMIMNSLYLFCVAYPGNLTPDSIDQMTQLITNEYRNHHPFWHTVVIKVWISIGFRLFHNINAAVATYSCFLIIFMAAIFSYMIMTMYEIGIPDQWLIVIVLITIFSPYHIAYSVTMWKDVVFGGAISLFVTSFLRILSGIGREKVNYLFFACSGIGFGLWRSNGWFAFALTFIVSIFLLRKRNKKILFYMAALLAITFILKHPVLKILNVPQADTVEALSIPAQQIARVIYDGGELTEEERIELSKIADLEAIPQEYLYYLSDPIKSDIRAHGHDYLVDHKMEFLKIWISIGLRHPAEYVEAWIDQTRGYWNSGYQYVIWADFVQENSLGIERKVGSELMADKVHSYFDSYSNLSFFQPMHSIGLTVWITVAAFVIGLIRKDKNIILAVPGIAIVLSLIISTPVASEFRYGYGLFTAFPIVVFTLFYPGGKQQTSRLS